MVFLIILIVVFLVLLMMEILGFDFNNFMASFAAGTVIIVFLIVHLFQGKKKKNRSKKIIEFRKKFLIPYNILNTYETPWGFLSFGDKLCIEITNEKQVEGYLSCLNDELEIVTEGAEILKIPILNIKNVVNNGLDSFLFQPIKFSKEYEYRTSFRLYGGYIRTTWVKYYTIWDSLSTVIEVCIKNKDYALWNKLRIINENSNIRTFIPLRGFDTKMQAHDDQNKMIKSMTSMFTQNIDTGK